MTIAWDVPLHGDTEAAMVEILTTDPNIIANFPTLTVSTDLIGYDNGKEWIEVARKGGNLAPWQRVDKPRVDFYIYGPNRARTLDLGQMAMRAIFQAMGNYAGKGIRLVSGVVETGLTRTPDLNNDSARYVLALRLTVVPE